MVAGESNGHADPDEEHAPTEAQKHGGHGHGIHMPSPSYFPLIAALGLPILAYGLLYSTILIVDGVITIMVGLYGWAVEPSAEPG